MVVSHRSQDVNLPVAPVAAAVIGLGTAAMFALVPTDLLESLVMDSGIAAVLAAAEPPLGMTARLALALVGGAGVGLVAWFGLFLMFGTRTIVVQRGGHGARGGEDGDGDGDGGGDGDAPVLRRADAHPDAPARRPLLANTDLGVPFPARAATKEGAKQVGTVVESVPVVQMLAIAPPPPERPLPVDLDQPLAAYDPGAVPDQPVAWLPPPADISPQPQPQPQPRPEPIMAPEPAPLAAAKPDPAQTIHDLLDRLERVSARSAQHAAAAPVSPETIEDTLATLRKLATRANGSFLDR